jgi:hypothetical protein
MFKYIRYEESQDEFTKLTFVQKNEDVKVITFDKPIAALEADDESVIDELISYQDKSINCEVIDYDEFKALAETTAQYSRVLEVVEDSLNKSMEFIENKYPAKERETWNIQKDEAIKYLETKKEADAPFLKVLADAEDDTLESFATAVVQKNQAVTMMSANAIKEKRLLKRELLFDLGF